MDKKWYPLRTVLLACGLSFGAGAAGMAYGPQMVQAIVQKTDETQKLEQLEQILGKKFQSTKREAYQRFLTAPDAWQLVEMLGNTLDESLIRYGTYEEFLEQPTALDIVKHMTDKKKVNALVRLPLCKSLTQHSKTPELVRLLGDSFDPEQCISYKELLKAPYALEFLAVLELEFSVTHIPEYSLLAQDSNGPKLVRALGKQFDPQLTERYQTLLAAEHGLQLAEALRESFQNQNLERYTKLAKSAQGAELAKTLNDSLHTLTEEKFSEYLTLLEHDVPVATIVQLRAEGIARNIKLLDKHKDIPPEFKQHLVNSQQEYSIRAAGSKPVFGSEKAKVRGYIKKKITPKKHCKRSWKNYDESIGQIDDIDNINILYLIKEYVDFLDKSENVQSIIKMIEADFNDPYSEHGGAVLFEETGYRFALISSKDKKKNPLNLENDEYYRYPHGWVDRIGMIGIFHFHALREDSSIVCGPSGTVLHGGHDIGCLYDSGNPYQIDIVITKLKESTFNADIYFRDIDDRLATILDLGVYGGNQKE